MAHVERAFALPPWETRTDVPPWMRDIALVTTLHGMHYTGFMFNDYAQHAGDPALDGDADSRRPRARVHLARGTAATTGTIRTTSRRRAWAARPGFRRLISEGQKLGFKMMPMFGANSANRKQPIVADDRERRRRTRSTATATT